MPYTRRRWNLVVACLNLVAGVAWIVLALRRFDRLSLLDGYHFPEYRGLHAHSSGGVLLPCLAGLIFLVAAAIGFLNWRREPGHNADRAITTLFEHDKDAD